MTRKPQPNTRFILTLPVSLKKRLDVRVQGYSLSGFIRAAIEKALDELERHQYAIVHNITQATRKRCGVSGK